MRRIPLWVCALLIAWWSPLGWAQEAYQGLVLSTPYPAQVIKASEPVTLSLTVRNYGLPPQVVTLEVVQAPEGWRTTLLGGGRIVKAVYLEPEGLATVSLKVEPPAEAPAGAYRFEVVARGQDPEAQSTLPLELSVGEALPPQLQLEVELPVLKGTPTTTFRYRATLKNDSDQDLLVNLTADLPAGFQVKFKPSFGSQEVTSLPVKAGESKTLDIELDPPDRVPAGQYEALVRAQAEGVSAQLELTAEVTGQPELSVTTPDGRLSASAAAGRPTTLELVVRNQGSAPARGVELSSFPPSGWEITFDPKKIEEIPPDGEAQVTARLKPADKAVAGDYMVTVNARSQGNSESARFRITVKTSTLWGIVGVILIAVALGVVSLAVVRFGRR